MRTPDTVSTPPLWWCWGLVTHCLAPNIEPMGRSCEYSRCVFVWYGVVLCAEAPGTTRKWLGCAAYRNSKTGKGVCPCSLCEGLGRGLGSCSLFNATLATPGRFACRCSGNTRKAHTMELGGFDEAWHMSAMPCGSGRWNFCISLSRRLGQWALNDFLRGASLPRGHRQCPSCL